LPSGATCGLPPATTAVNRIPQPGRFEGKSTWNKDFIDTVATLRFCARISVHCDGNAGSIQCKDSGLKIKKTIIKHARIYKYTIGISSKPPITAAYVLEVYFPLVFSREIYNSGNDNKNFCIKFKF